METTGDDSGSRTTGQASGSGSANNRQTSSNKDSVSQTDGGESSQQCNTAGGLETVRGKGEEKEAGPSKSSTPRKFDSPIGGITFDTFGGDHRKPLEIRKISATPDDASLPAPANEVSPAPTPLSSLPQDVEITEWALSELYSLLPQETDESLRQTIKTA